jgi:hypothetical protein
VIGGLPPSGRRRSGLSLKASILALYSRTGFYAPVDMPTSTNPIVCNTIRGGQTVPLKFEIFSVQAGHAEQTGLGVFGTDAFKVTQVACTTVAGTITDDVEMVSTAAPASGTTRPAISTSRTGRRPQARTPVMRCR